MQERGRILGIVVPLVTVGALIMLLMFALTRLAQIQHDMRSNVSANMLWVITQTQVKTLRLTSVLQQHLHDGSQAEQVSDVYRLLVSRFNLLSDGPQKRFLDKLDGGHELAEYMQAVRREASMLTLNHPGETVAARRLLNTLAELDGGLAYVAGKTMVAQWEEFGSRLDRYRNGVLTIIFLMLGICVCAFIISAHMFVALLRVRESEWARHQALQLQSQLDAERQVSELHRNFGAMISHQFRTPLAIMDASMQRILRSGDRMDHKDLVRRVQKVRRAIARLARLVEHTRIADQFSDLLDVNLQACSLELLTESVVQQKREIAPDRVIEFEPSAEAHLPDAYCDPVLVEHIVFNFLSNAVKYSAGDTVIRVSVFQENDWVCCEVADQGIGIRQHDEPYVFDRYFRGQGVADTPGTGMGLYVAYKLAQLQGGGVSVAPNPQGGTIFRVCFPLADTLIQEQFDAAVSTV